MTLRILVTSLLLAACSHGGGGAPVGTSGSFDACGGRIVGSSGAIDADEYTKQALAWDLKTIDCRLGTSYASAHPQADDNRPTAYEPPKQHSSIGRNGAGLDYELGGPPSDAPPSNNIFGSVIDQIMYVADEADDPGLDRISTYDWSVNTIVEHPEPVWWGTNNVGDRYPDPSVDPTYMGNGQDAAWAAALGRPVDQPYIMARSTMTWSNDAVMIFKPGLMGSSGSQTSSDTFPHFLFPANKVPMAIAVTSQNELTLVGVWDTDSQKGQLAVIANLAQGLSPVHSWPYFAMPNGGSYSAFKLLGYVDLPFATPTAIAASDDVNTPVPGAQQGNWTLLDTQAGRDGAATYMPCGGCTNNIMVANAGYAMVASQWENELAFVDLQPLFAFLRTQYLTTQDKFDAVNTTDPSAWPFTFDTNPEMAPIVLTTLSVTPRAVLAGARRYDDDVFAHVASEDGTITSYTVASLAGIADAVASDVQVQSTVRVGASPVAMAWPRNGDPLESTSSPYEHNTDFLVVSRAEREIDWIKMDKTSTTSTIYRSFQDSRMSDPVDIDVDERTYIVTVADFHSKQVLNYRFAPTDPEALTPSRSIGMGADGTAASECGGTLAIPGAVFHVSSTNVN